MMGAAIVPGWDAAGFMDPDLIVKPDKEEFLEQSLREWSSIMTTRTREELNADVVVRQPRLLMDAILDIRRLRAHSGRREEDAKILTELEEEELDRYLIRFGRDMMRSG